MKKLALILVMFITGLVSAQTSNQFDAEGKRHGIWKKYFDDTVETEKRRYRYTLKLLVE